MDKCYATAIYVKIEGGDIYLFCEPDGFTSKSLDIFLRNKLKDEYAWISELKLQGWNWDATDVDLNSIWFNIGEAINALP